MVLSGLCAYVMVQPNMTVPHSLLPQAEESPMRASRFGHDLLHETLHVRNRCGYNEHPTIYMVYTAFFISNCYSGLDKQDAAWVHLREATTLTHVMCLHDQNHYKDENLIGTRLERRLFWALFITER